MDPLGSQTPILQQAQFENCTGTRQECTEENFGPIGTGPFVVTEFKPNDVIQLKANDNYRDPANQLQYGFQVVATLLQLVEPLWKPESTITASNLQLAPEVINQMASAEKVNRLLLSVLQLSD